MLCLKVQQIAAVRLLQKMLLFTANGLHLVNIHQAARNLFVALLREIKNDCIAKSYRRLAYRWLVLAELTTALTCSSRKLCSGARLAYCIDRCWQWSERCGISVWIRHPEHPEVVQICKIQKERNSLSFRAQICSCWGAGC
jgi:hypothetical protein